MLDRPSGFTQIGRSIDLAESLNIDEAILQMFKDENLPFFWLKGLREDAVDVAYKYVESRKKRGK
jgi:hypothetical protein